MADNLSVSLSKLKSTSSQLNELTDKANETVRAVEKFLVEECRAGSPTGVPISGIAMAGSYECLAYDKHGGKFRIGIARLYIEQERLEDMIPWANLSRDAKLRAIHRLPDLIDKIQNDLNERVTNARKAIERLHDALPVLNSGEDK